MSIHKVINLLDALYDARNPNHPSEPWVCTLQQDVCPKMATCDKCPLNTKESYEKTMQELRAIALIMGDSDDK